MTPGDWSGQERRTNPPLPEWTPPEPTAFQKVAQSLVEVSLITGLLLRLFRAVILTHGAPDNLLYLGGAFAIGAIFLLSMMTVHLSRVPLNQWMWRAPAFALLESIAEAMVSLALISLAREPLGSARAEMHDWPGMAFSILLTRFVVLCVFALLLGLIVQRLRSSAVAKERGRAGIMRSEIGRSVLSRNSDI
jgi:hypothetical protein